MPLPTVIVMDPPWPPDAAPEPIDTEPDPPLDADPDENTNRPLEPAAPAFIDRIDTLPLDDAVPSPDASESKPPVVVVLRPAATVMEPP